jgi:hypothetical protein
LDNQGFAGEYVVREVNFKEPPNDLGDGLFDAVFILDNTSHVDWFTERYPGTVYCFDHHSGGQPIEHPNRLQMLVLSLFKGAPSTCMLMMALFPNAKLTHEQVAKMELIGRYDTYQFHPETKEVDLTCILALNHLLRSREHSFKDLMSEKWTLDSLYQYGTVLRKDQQERMSEAKKTLITPSVVAVVIPPNSSDIVSELGERISSEHDGAIVAMYEGGLSDNLRLYLRSQGNKNDCVAFARSFDVKGGGHFNAAGCSVSRTTWLSFLLSGEKK